MAVDVVVVNYKTPDYLAQFWESYAEHAFEGCTLTVVDVDAPLDARDFFTDDKRLIFVPENIGYGKAVNLGATFGRNDVILIANADTQLTADFEFCYEALTLRDDWGALSPRQTDEGGKITHGGIFSYGAMLHHQRAWHEVDRGQCSDVRDDASMIGGALCFVKRSIWEMLTECPFYQAYQPGVRGAFLETTHYFEDTWFSDHLLAHGYRCVFYGPARMHHFWHRASAHGGWADQQFQPSLAKYREACLAHNIVGE